VALSTELTAALGDAVDEVARRVIDRLASWGISCPRRTVESDA
jgi:hypothetical protein